MSRKLIVGLGNPGPEYSLTRHNVGFLVVECLSDSEFLKAALAHAKTLPFSPEAKQNYKSPRNDLGRNGSSSQFKLVREHQAEIAVLPQFNLLIAKPVTYMNCSGEAVQKILHYFKIELENLLVVHDDVSLPLGKLRLQNGGGAGGQHGIESIIARLGGKTDFHRLKVGVGPDPGGATRANYVLSTVPAVDRALFADSIASAAEAAAAWLQGGLRITMNAYNGLEIGVPAALQEKRARDQQAREEKERKQ
ncbi:MAG TPA: aminoacyl-tRNA hydrolase, partial [Chroococcales cyanobacterium]